MGAAEVWQDARMREYFCAPKFLHTAIEDRHQRTNVLVQEAGCSGRNMMEVPMRKFVLAAAALAMLGATPAFAADAIGRISYLAPDGKMLILDGQKEYNIASGVDVSKHGAAEFVRLTLGANDEVTAIGPGPAAQAGYWVGQTAGS
jgi:hypothetical protein